MSATRSLVLITIDCLRADHVGFMGYQRGTTPFLDSLAPKSIIFDNAIAVGVPTYYSLPAVMASRPPLAMGRDLVGLSPDDEPTLATSLNQIGYATAAFIAGNPYITERYGYSEGFDVFEDFLGDIVSDSNNHPKENQNGARGRVNQLLRWASGKIGLGAFYDELYFRYSLRLAERSPQSLDQMRCFPAADVIVSHAGEWIRRQHNDDTPFFLWLHLMDPHGPYYPPQDALDLMGRNRMTSTRARYLNSCWNRAGLSMKRCEAISEEVMSLYDSGIRWVDEQIATLAKTLQNLGMWDDCVFAVTADHGEEFLEHGGRMHTPPGVTEELVHVPLLLRVPAVDGQRISSPFSLLNFAPTLLDCLQAPVPVEFKGQSCWKKIRAGEDWNDEIVVECIAGCRNPARKQDRQGARLMAVREARYKLILDFNKRAEELFDLQADPQELNPLPHDKEKPVRKRLLEHARRHIANAELAKGTRPQAVLSLRNLVGEPGKEV